MTETEQLSQVFAITYSVAMILCLGFAMIAKHIGNLKMLVTFVGIFVLTAAFTVWISLT